MSFAICHTNTLPLSDHSEPVSECLLPSLFTSWPAALMATDTALSPATPPVSPHSSSTMQQLPDLPLNKLTHSTPTLPSTLTFTSTNPFHKRVLADRLDRDRLDKLQRICTGGAEGQPGVLSQVGFEPTLHQYSTSLPSAPSPSTSHAATRNSPSVSIPMPSSTPPTSALSPISASADSARFFHAPNQAALPLQTSNSVLPHSLPDSNRFPLTRAPTAAADVDEPLQPPKRRSTSFLPPPRSTSSSSFNFQPLVPSPSSAFAAPTTPPIAESEPADTDNTPAAATQRNTLLHYWACSSQSRQQQQHQQQLSSSSTLDDSADIQIIDNNRHEQHHRQPTRSPKAHTLPSRFQPQLTDVRMMSNNKRKAPTATTTAPVTAGVGDRDEAGESSWSGRKPS